MSNPGKSPAELLVVSLIVKFINEIQESMKKELLKAVIDNRMEDVVRVLGEFKEKDLQERLKDSLND